MNSKSAYVVAFACLLAIAPLALCVAAGIGAYPIHPIRIPAILWGQLEDEGFRVLMYIRLPRVALAAIVGAVLATSGAGLQGMFRNPLADPGLIGVTSGAALAASAWIVAAGGNTPLGFWGLPLAAFIGGLSVVWVVWKLSQSGGQTHTPTLLLMGVALNAFAGAGIGFVIYFSNEEELRGVMFWQLGGLTGATWPMAFAAAPAMIIGLLLLLPTGRRLNALALGDSEAYFLGVPTRPLQLRLIFGSALAVGGAVAAAGGIGFVGLVVPHLLRLAFGADNRWLLPSAALSGGILMIAADTAARTIVQPAEMPVGIITALVGGPVLIWLLLRHKKESVHA